MPDNLVPEEYVTRVCKPNNGDKTCAFLAMGQDGWECAKGTEIESIIRNRLKAGTIRATGDNCEGITKVGGGQ